MYYTLECVCVFEFLLLCAWLLVYVCDFPPFFQNLLKGSASNEVHKSVSKFFTDVANDSSLQTVPFATHFLPTILSQFESTNTSKSTFSLKKEEFYSKFADFSYLYL